MINKISVKNFKSLKHIDLPLKRLNILAGLNGMGKSSFIQILLLMRQSYLSKTWKLELKGDIIDIGKGYDALYQFSKDESIHFNFQWDKNKFAEYEFDWTAENNALNRVKKNVAQEHIDSYIHNLQYISAERMGPSIMYDMSQNFVEDGILGACGQYTSHFLSANGNRLKVDANRWHTAVSSPFLANQADAWLGEISPGIKINVTEVPGADKILLNYEFKLQKGRTQAFKPTNVGFGISYALSVIVALLIAKKNQIVIIENPEAHLHPHGQSELGKLMALAAASGAQLLVETHSDHIINGIRVAVKEKHLPCADVQCPWFYKITTEDEQYTDIINIQMDENGELSEYPDEFLEEWNNQLLRLI